MQHVSCQLKNTCNVVLVTHVGKTGNSEALTIMLRAHTYGVFKMYFIVIKGDG